jgi:hypothetical protein
MNERRIATSSTSDRFADVGGTVVGVVALCFFVLWYLAHLLG